MHSYRGPRSQALKSLFLWNLLSCELNVRFLHRLLFWRFWKVGEPAGSSWNSVRRSRSLWCAFCWSPCLCPHSCFLLCFLVPWGWGALPSCSSLRILCLSTAQKQWNLENHELESVSFEFMLSICQSNKNPGLLLWHFNDKQELYIAIMHITCFEILYTANGQFKSIGGGFNACICHYFEMKILKNILY